MDLNNKMSVHRESGAVVPPYEDVVCSARMEEGAKLLLTLSQHHLISIVVIFSTVACFWFLIMTHRRRKQRAELYEVEEGFTLDAVRVISRDVALCQAWVDNYDVMFGLFQLTAFLILLYVPPLLDHEKIVSAYVWRYVGRWHIAACVKTLWFIATLVICKSDLHRALRDVSLKYLRTSERPFNVIALYMMVTSYMLLPVVLDILSFYVFKDHYGYGFCVEVVNMSPLFVVIVIFYVKLIVTYAVFLCARCLRGTDLPVALSNMNNRQDEEPALLSDDENDPDKDDDNTISGNDTHSNETGNLDNVICDVTENHDFAGPIRTIDEVVGYEKDESRALDEIQVAKKRSVRTKIRLVGVATFQPLLLWLWVVVVLHGNAGFSSSNNVDFGNLALLWSVVAMCYVMVSTCFNRPR